MPDGSRTTFSVMPGKYFTVPLGILPNLLSVTAVTEESGALLSVWAAHHENSLSEIMTWVEFPPLVLAV